MSKPTSQRILEATLMGKIDEAEADRAMDIALRIEMGSYTCPLTGVILDSRTAQAIRIEGPDAEGNTTEQIIVVGPAIDIEATIVETNLVERFPESDVTHFNAVDVWAKIGGRR